MKKMKKLLCMALCVATLTATLAGCGPKAGQETGDGNQVTFSVNNWPKETEKEKLATFNAYLEKLKTQHPEISLKTYTTGYSVETFFVDAASGQLTNLYYAPYTEAKKIIDAGYAKDITKWIVENGYDTGVNPGVMKLLTKWG